MCDCMICARIELIRAGKNPYFVRELETGYVVLGDHQRIPGYTLFLCKRHATDLHLVDAAFRKEFLWEMSVTAEAVSRAFHAEKMNYELLGTGRGLHMHWHLFPRREGDTPRPGPVWQLGSELFEERFLPDRDALDLLRDRLNTELDLLLKAPQK